MGEGATDDRSDGDLLDGDADAPWRPGFDGWEAMPSAVSDGALIGDRGVDVESQRWSQEQVERVPEPWVPTRPERIPRPAPAPVGVPVAEVPGQPSSATTGEVVLAAIVVAVLVAGAVVAGVAVRPSPGSTPDPSAPVVGANADTRWSVAFDRPADDVGVGADGVAVAAGADVVLLDGATGDERWRLTQDDPDVDVDRIVVVGEQVVVQQRSATGRPEVRAFSLDAGTPLWDTASSDGVVTISGPDDDPLLFRRIQEGGTASVELLDASTGVAASPPLRLSGVSASGDDIAVQLSDRRVAIWSRRERGVVTGEVDEFNLRMATPYDGSVVALGKEARLILFDADGRRADERPFVSDAFGEFASRPELVGVVGDVGVVASGITVGFDLAEGSIEPAWRRDGRMGPPVRTSSGTFAVLVGPEADGQIRESIIDPFDGSTLVVTDPDGKRERSPLLGHDAYVLAPTIGAPARVVAAFGYDGDPWWSVELPDDASYDVAHGVLVVVEREPDGSRVSLAR